MRLQVQFHYESFGRFRESVGKFSAYDFSVDTRAGCIYNQIIVFGIVLFSLTVIGGLKDAA